MTADLNVKRAFLDQLSVYSRLFGGGGSPPQKTYNSPPNGCQIMCSRSLFFGQDNELQIHHGNILLMDNKHRKLFVIKQSGANLYLKCTKMRVAAGLRSDTPVELHQTS